MTRWSLAVASILTLAACSASPPQPAVAPAAPVAAARPSGLMLSHFDRSVRVQHDL